VPPDVRFIALPQTSQLYLRGPISKGRVGEKEEEGGEGREREGKRRRREGREWPAPQIFWPRTAPDIHRTRMYQLLLQRINLRPRGYLMLVVAV